jgi:EmrB/QacA subfamily drug resistance transporter
MTLVQDRVPIRPDAPGLLTSAVLGVGVWMANLDLFIVNLALPAIGSDFGSAEVTDLSWVLTGYATVFAALLVPAGRWADRVGRRRAYQAGLGLFTAASALAAAADGLGLLVVARLLQAAGAALLVPTSLALILAVVPLEKRARAIGSWAAAGAVAAGVGPVLGGLLVEASWRWVFLVNVPVGVVTMLAVSRVIPESRAPLPRPVDAPGAVVLAAGVGLLALGLVRTEQWGWASSGVGGILLCSALLLTWVARRAWTHPAPVISAELLRVRQFALAALASLLFYAAFAVMLLFCVLWLSGVWDYSPLRAGLALAAGPAVVPAVARFLAPALMQRAGAGATAALGSAVFAAGLVAWTLTLSSPPDYVVGMLPGLLLTGAGVGLALPPLVTVGAAALPPAAFATGSAVVAMFRQIGAVAGTATFAAAASTTTPDALTDGLHPFVVVCLASVGCCVALGRARTAAPVT